ncbi:hypothetical protein [Chromatium okenii]|nr:hypothetical protein [Chromatium okenii]
MDKLQIERLRDHLQNFNFTALFIEELGWSYTHDQPFLMTAQGNHFR